MPDTRSIAERIRSCARETVTRCAPAGLRCSIPRTSVARRFSAANEPLAGLTPSPRLRRSTEPLVQVEALRHEDYFELNDNPTCEPA
jgi:hypothetical protein